MSESESIPDEVVIPGEGGLGQEQEGLHLVEIGSASQEVKPSYEGLLDEVVTLRSTVEGLKQALAKKDKKILKQGKALTATVEGLKESLKRKKDKIRKQGKALKDIKGMFSKAQWASLIKQREQRKVSLAKSLKLERSLIETVEGLKDCMAKAGKHVREKEEEVRKLGKKVERLRERAQHRENAPNLKGATEEEDAEANRLMTMQGGDARAAVAILPEEVWELILGKLSNPKDLWNCCNTSQLFENLLRPWKTGWMLEQTLPHLYRHLSGSKLLECRQVSKGWHAGVSDFFENHPSTKPHRTDRDPRRIDFVYPIKEKEIGNRNVFTFGPGEDLSDLERLFPKELARNPFLGRYVIFHLRKPGGLDSLEEEEQRWTKMYDFLKTYGKEIWNLAVYFPAQIGPPLLERITELLTSKLFQLVPNLRKLDISDTYCPMDSIDLEVLPPAPNLRTLQVGPLDEDGIVDVLINKYHLQLEALRLFDTAWELVHDLEWPNLKELFILFLNRDEYYEDEDVDLRTLFGLRMPQLSRLTLCFDDIRALDFPLLVAAINELAVTTSLNSFGLVGPSGPFEDIVSEAEQLATNVFVLEGVKTLEIIQPWDGNSVGLVSHNFLRYFPFIENLVIMAGKPSPGCKYTTEEDLVPDEECRRIVEGLERVDEFVEVNKYAYVGQMYKSNIWELLPRLKVFTVQWEVYTRENYEAYAKQRPSSSNREGGSME